MENQNYAVAALVPADCHAGIKYFAPFSPGCTIANTSPTKFYILFTVHHVMIIGK
jgi:hypothetical protein